MSSRYHRRHSYFHDRRLTLDRSRKKLGGVCAGIADYLDISPLLIRVCALICLCIATQATLIAYGVAYVVLDSRSCI